ncbi:MAG: hypothetical protein ACLFWL_13515 [Candidatus Brocadiia bacterium]
MDIQIKCKECKEEFNPDLNNKKGWTCPNCGAQNPDLRKHYKIVGVITAILFAGMVALIIFSISRVGKVAWGHVIPLIMALLSLVVAAILLFSDVPWQNPNAIGLMWLLYATYLAMVILLLIVSVIGEVTHPGRTISILSVLGIFFLVMFGYIYWVHKQTRRCRIE